MRVPALILLSIITATPVAAIAASGADEVIEFRKSVMNTAGHSARLLDHINKGTLDADAHFVSLANQMAVAASMMKDAYRQDTSDQNAKTRTQAKPDIWENWNDFAARTDAFAKDTAATAALANTGNIAGAKASLKAVLSHCKNCHEKYED